MKRIVSIFAVSVLAVSCAGKSAENVAGSEAAGQLEPLKEIKIGAILSIETEPARKAVQKAVGQSQPVFVGDQLKYFGPVRGGLHQFKWLANPETKRTGSSTPYVANLTTAVVLQVQREKEAAFQRQRAALEKQIAADREICSTNVLADACGTDEGRCLLEEKMPEGCVCVCIFSGKKVFGAATNRSF